MNHAQRQDIIAIVADIGIKDERGLVFVVLSPAQEWPKHQCRGIKKRPDISASMDSLSDGQHGADSYFPVRGGNGGALFLGNHAASSRRTRSYFTSPARFVHSYGSVNSS